MAAMSQQPAPTASGPMLPPGVLDHPILFDTEAARAAVRAAASTRTWRIVSLCISLAISGAIWWFFREQLGDLTWTWVAVAVVWPLTSLVVAVVREQVVRRDARAVSEGLALGVGRRGLWLGGLDVPWVEVGAVRALSGRLGASRRLRVETRAGEFREVPLDYLASSPAGVDAGVFALSGGRVRVDFSALDA